MTTSSSNFATEQIKSTLKSGDGTLVLDLLAEIEASPFAKQVVEALQQTLPEVRDPVLAFQVAKTVRYQLLKLRGAIQPSTLADLQGVLSDPAKLEDLALVMTRLESSDAFLANDLLRSSAWNTLPPEVLPSICSYFKRFGDIRDSDSLVELCRHHQPVVLAAALDALEKIDPDNLQSLVTPLLDNPNPGIRAKAIKSLYRWDKPHALRYLVELMFAQEQTERTLALHHAASFPYAEIEPHLLRFAAEVDDPRLLLRVSHIFKANAHVELPFRLYWICRNLRGQHQNLVKGILLGVARALADTKKISMSAQEFLDQLKTRVKAEEERLLRVSITSISEQTPLPPDISTAETDQDTQPKVASQANPIEAAGPHAVSPSSQSFLPDLEPSASKSSPEEIDVPGRPAPPPMNIDEYDSFDPTARIQLLNRLSIDGYRVLKSRLPSLIRDARGKELGALIKVIGRFGSSEDAQIVKPYLAKENPDEVSAAIDALSKLDSEYLCIYLPQLMQHKNGKIRMNATRAFGGIDRDQIKSLVSSLLMSNSVRQRALGIPAATLVDFGLVREPLLKAFHQEANPELVEKIGLILCSNPDREILHSVALAVEAAPDVIAEQKKIILKQLAEKLSIALDKISSPEELLAGETATLEKPNSSTPDPKESISASSAGHAAVPSMEPHEKIAKAFQNEPIIRQAKPEQAEQERKEQRAKMTIVVWILVAVVWGAMIVSILPRFLFGE
ncbi:HEAT repeat domain-containing protein [Candidatus Ozemobacteraceae bacterium]|nr:HEAT repeat domain-containing protein [Candidatus Ozemobacteraceae bacterium]